MKSETSVEASSYGDASMTTLPSSLQKSKSKESKSMYVYKHQSAPSHP